MIVHFRHGAPGATTRRRPVNRLYWVSSSRMLEAKPGASAQLRNIAGSTLETTGTWNGEGSHRNGRKRFGDRHSRSQRARDLPLLGQDALPAVLGGSQRLLSLLSLRDRALVRASVAGTLWPESTEGHAYSSLRSALGRLSRMGGAHGDRDAARSLLGRRRDGRHPGVASARPSSAQSGCGAVGRRSQRRRHRCALPRRAPRLVRRLGACRSRGVAPAPPPHARRAGRPTPHRAAIRRGDRRGTGRGAGGATASLTAFVIRVHLAEGNQSEALAEFGSTARSCTPSSAWNRHHGLRELIADLLNP